MQPISESRFDAPAALRRGVGRLEAPKRGRLMPVTGCLETDDGDGRRQRDDDEAESEGRPCCGEPGGDREHQDRADQEPDVQRVPLLEKVVVQREEGDRVDRDGDRDGEDRSEGAERRFSSIT